MFVNWMQILINAKSAIRKVFMTRNPAFIWKVSDFWLWLGCLIKEFFTKPRVLGLREQKFLLSPL